MGLVRVERRLMFQFYVFVLETILKEGIRRVRKEVNFFMDFLRTIASTPQMIFPLLLHPRKFPSHFLEANIRFPKSSLMESFEKNWITFVNMHLQPEDVKSMGRKKLEGIPAIIIDVFNKSQKRLRKNASTSK